MLALFICFERLLVASKMREIFDNMIGFKLIAVEEYSFTGSRNKFGCSFDVEKLISY